MADFNDSEASMSPKSTGDVRFLSYFLAFFSVWGGGFLLLTLEDSPLHVVKNLARPAVGRWVEGLHSCFFSAYVQWPMLW